MCGKKTCRYNCICSLYEDHYQFGRCFSDLLGEKECERKLKHLMNGNGLVVDRNNKVDYNEIKEELHE